MTSFPSQNREKGWKLHSLLTLPGSTNAGFSARWAPGESQVARAWNGCGMDTLKRGTTYMKGNASSKHQFSGGYNGTYNYVSL